MVLALPIIEFNPGQSFDSVQAEYQDKLTTYMSDYLQSDRPITAFKYEFGRAVNDGFTFAFIAGWADAGASQLTDKAQQWLNDRIANEIQFVSPLFIDLKALRDDDTIPMADKLASANMHAEAYANTLTGVYAQGKMMGDPERDGKWIYGDTVEHCDTCQMLNGKVHPLSWYIDNDYIPQQAGSSTLDCGGWRCLCTIVDPKTGDVLIP